MALNFVEKQGPRIRYGNPRKELSRVSACFDVWAQLGFALSPNETTKAFLPQAKRISASNYLDFWSNI